MESSVFNGCQYCCLITPVREIKASFAIIVFSLTYTNFFIAVLIAFIKLKNKSGKGNLVWNSMLITNLDLFYAYSWKIFEIPEDNQKQFLGGKTGHIF